MTKPITFTYGERVRVKVPGKRAFFGKYYSEYRDRPRAHRTICVEHESGAGVGYPLRYVSKVE